MSAPTTSFSDKKTTPVYQEVNPTQQTTQAYSRRRYTQMPQRTNREENRQGVWDLSWLVCCLCCTWIKAQNL